jgi:hypothetical protein
MTDSATRSTATQATATRSWQPEIIADLLHERHRHDGCTAPTVASGRPAIASVNQCPVEHLVRAAATPASTGGGAK